jgi:hypothetical protein
MKEADIHTVAGATQTSTQKSGVIAMLLSVGAGASGSLDPFDAHYKQHDTPGFFKKARNRTRRKSGFFEKLM